MHKDSTRLGQSGSNLVEIVVCGAFQVPLAVNQSHGTVQTSTRTKAGAIGGVVGRVRMAVFSPLRDHP